MWAQEHSVSVIRMGLAPEAGLREAVVAGPQHPSLGSRVMARALFLQVAREVKSLSCGRLSHLSLPRHTQGFFWGERREMESAWNSLGLRPSQIRFETSKDAVLTFVQG